MGHWAKQSTAVSYVVGPILDSAGAEYASAVIGDLSLSKNGGTLTALASAATLTYIANGQYTLALTTGNTDTLGTARILCNKSTYQMPPLELMVLPATVYDALTTNATNTTGGLPAATAAVTALSGYVGASGAAVNGTNVNTLASHDPGATIGTSTLTGTQAATAVWQDTTAGDFTVALSVGKSVMNGVALGTGLTVARCTLTDTLTTYTGNTPQTGDSFARIGAAGAGLTALGDTRVANLDAAVSSRGTSTLTQTQVTGGAYALNHASFAFNAVLPLTTQQKADVNAEADTALADAGVTTTVTGRIDVAISTRLASDSYTTPPTAVQNRQEMDSNSIGLAAIFARTDVATSTRMATYTQPTGFLAATFPSGTVASTTNVTAGTVTTVSGSVDGNVGGKVLGGGAGTITAAGAWALDGSGNAVAPASATTAIKARTDLIPASPAAVGSAMTLTSGERDSIAAALLDLANGVESGKTLRQALRLMAAALAGKRSNAGTASEQYDAVGSPGTARIVANADASGNGTPTLTP